MTTTWRLSAYPAEFCSSGDLPGGDGIAVPMSILEDIKDLDLGQIHFEISGNLHSKVCSTPSRFLDGDDQNAYLPDWMFQNLYLQPGDQATLDLVASPLPKATRLKLQPHDSAFLTLPDHKSQLEKGLACFKTVTPSSVIEVALEGEKFEISVSDAEPPGPNLSLVDTDVSIEFEAPLDYVEQKPEDWPAEEDWPLALGVRITEERLTVPKVDVLSDGRHITVRPPAPAAPLALPAPETTPKPDGFVPFSGRGHRLGS